VATAGDTLSLDLPLFTLYNKILWRLIDKKLIKDTTSYVKELNYLSYNIMIDKDSILSKYKYYDDNTTHIMYFIFTSFFYLTRNFFS